jgi:hypothetical protein
MLHLMVKADESAVRDTLRTYVPDMRFSVRKGSGSTQGQTIVHGECPDGQDWAEWSGAIRFLLATLGKVV